ncbi:reverse transcriptase domain-containing protein [Tanacetum coccineum]
MAPKRAPRSTPVTENPTTTTVTNAQLQAMIDQGVTAALVAQDARNGDDIHTLGTGVRRNEHAARECTYSDFLKCKPLNFKGTEGVVGLTHCPCNAMETLKKMMTDKYCPRGKIKKIEFEMWNLKVKGTDVVTYNQCFQELALMCDQMFPEESDKNKRKLDNNNQTQQQLSKRQNVAQAYAAGTGERKEYAGTLPLCNKCKFHHNGPCTVKCVNCKRVGHLTRDCWSSAATNNQRTLTCYECGNQGHYKSDCPELKNGNQAGGARTRGMVLALVGGEPNQDLDDMEDNTNA